MPSLPTRDLVTKRSQTRPSSSSSSTHASPHSQRRRTLGGPIGSPIAARALAPSSRTSPAPHRTPTAHSAAAARRSSIGRGGGGGVSLSAGTGSGVGGHSPLSLRLPTGAIPPTSPSSSRSPPSHLSPRSPRAVVSASLAAAAGLVGGRMERGRGIDVEPVEQMVHMLREQSEGLQEHFAETLKLLQGYSVDLRSSECDEDKDFYMSLVQRTFLRLDGKHCEMSKISENMHEIAQRLIQTLREPCKQSSVVVAWLRSVHLSELPIWSKKRDGRWDGVEWSISERGTKYVNSMLTADQGNNWEEAPLRCGEVKTGIVRLPVKGRLYGLETDHSLYMSVHHVGATKQAIKLLENGVACRVAITGPEGIGKSYLLRYALLELVKKGNIVVLVCASEKTAFLFTPSLQSRKDYMCFEVDNFDPGACAALRYESCWYLFDPCGAESVYNVAQYSAYAKTILAASPDERHYSEMLKHRGRQLVVPPRSTDEVVACWRLGMGVEWFGEYNANRPAHCRDVESKIRHRCSVVGGLLRYVLCDESTFAMREVKVKRALQALGRTDRSMFEGELSAEWSSMCGEYAPHLLFHTKSEHIPEVKDGELVALGSNAYSPSSEAWLHTFGMTCRLYELSQMHILRRIADGEHMCNAAVGDEFEHIMKLLLTRPSSSVPSTVTAYNVKLVIRDDVGEHHDIVDVPEDLARLTPDITMSDSVHDALQRLEYVSDLGHVFKDSSGVLVSEGDTNPLWDVALASNVITKITARRRRHELLAEPLKEIMMKQFGRQPEANAQLHVIWIVPQAKTATIHPKPVWSSSAGNELQRRVRKHWNEVFQDHVVQHTAHLEVHY